ncbi:MAG: hypothetical protein IPF98_20900 [Gemmatimonadetes bacterium]|nr:hypothetical protein [Gemmatimonadota bacterium]MCC6772757.1 hypothetical protein [Gemmatimonadaceae bacterium]
MRRFAPFAVLATFVLPAAATSQVLQVRPVTPEAAAPLVGVLRDKQARFEAIRRTNLPRLNLRGGGAGRCDEQVGRFCYWYDERDPGAPEEPSTIAEARNTLVSMLDSAYAEFPDDRWTSGQLVRYMTESGRTSDAVRAADRCQVGGWWCPALQGFALHEAGRFASADSAWDRALALMNEAQRCEWRDLKLVLDFQLLRDYRESDCARRETLERRVWWLAQPMLSLQGNDARSEFLSRRLYTVFVEDAPSVYAMGFDDDERELLLRYGWPRAWSQHEVYVQGRGSQRVITGHEPSPAPPMLPVAATVRNPALSDSLGWRGKGLPGVRARYAPEVARRLLPLMHQSAIFRRGDSAMVVMAYDARGDKALAAAAESGELTAALVLTKGEEADATIVRLPTPGVQGTITARTSWGPMLMSAEVATRKAKTLARARYGMRASDSPGSRVSISDLLLFEPYDGMPRTLEDVLPHASASQVMREGSKVGIYWETYNTNPGGEGIQVAITVAPEEQESGGWLQRGLTALKLVREAQPVSVGLSDVSTRGLGYTPRAVVVDLATLKPGRYLMQLEITAEGTIPVRGERVLMVRGR